MQKLVDNYTFGDSEAEVTLSKILTKIGDPHLTKRVATILFRADILRKKLSHLDKELKNYLYLIIRKDFISRIEKNIYIEKYPEIKSFIKNSVAKKLRPLCKK